nr:MAG TPA: hypothetical protein [Caudoviricetes sp.]
MLNPCNINGLSILLLKGYNIVTILRLTLTLQKNI